MIFKRNQSSMNLGDPTTGKYPRKEPSLKDEDKMPFGKHKGELMQDVPAPYLAWLWNEGCNNELVYNYIWNSFDAINMELDEDKQMLRK